MSKLQPETLLKRRVARGARYLDETNRGWYKNISTNLLNMSNSCNCICGQLNIFHHEPVSNLYLYNALGVDIGLGFTLPNREAVGSSEWFKLAALWIQQINKRNKGKKKSKRVKP